MGLFCGDDKSGLHAFLTGDTDILVTSNVVSTGFDGLQPVSNPLVITTLPWTQVELDQLVGRLYRQGQAHPDVDIFIPVTYGTSHGNTWSWCESKLKRLVSKRSLAETAVEGVVPSTDLPTPERSYHDLMKWLNRLSAEPTVQHTGGLS